MAKGKSKGSADTSGMPEASRRQAVIACLALAMIGLSLTVRMAVRGDETERYWGVLVWDWPLLFGLFVGGTPLIFELLAKVRRGQWGADLLAGISIVTSVFLEEYLAGVLVVLMLSGGEALEAFAVRSASSVLEALARRMPSVAQKRVGAQLVEIPLEDIIVGDELVIVPHGISPVDGTVIEGHGDMDESFLTGEPYQLAKGPGARVLSGAVNGATALVIRADRLPVDSRYAQIMQVMRDSEQNRPNMRRLGDQLGAWYTPVAVGIALMAWLLSGESTRFLAVLVVATPCPLLIAIPVAIIGAISLSARRGIVVKDPTVLERLDTCRIAIFDKTGTLTYGRPRLTEILLAPPEARPVLNAVTDGKTNAPGEKEKGKEKEPDWERLILSLAVSLEQYSRHPLASAILDEAKRRGITWTQAEQIQEIPGKGLAGRIRGQDVMITGRGVLAGLLGEDAARALLPPAAAGMECLVLVDNTYAACFRFRDQPRQDGANFIKHLGPRHQFDRVMLLSGDRESEVRYLAEQVGITEVHAGQTPEQKLDMVRELTRGKPTLFVGDGINDAPALTAATVGLAFGQNSDITTEAAGAVIMDSDLRRVDEFLHISRRMRVIALQSALGGMFLSILGMFAAAFGLLTPVAGALAQEAIDVVAVLNALRVAFPRSKLADFDEPPPTP